MPIRATALCVAVLAAPALLALNEPSGLDSSAFEPRGVEARSPGRWHDGLALPSQRVVMLCPSPGLLTELLVDDGSEVARGDLLAQLDDRLQKVALESAEAEAANTAPIEAARLQRDQAEIDLENAQKAMEANAASDWEIRRARLERDIAALRIGIAEHELQLAAFQARAHTVRLEQLSIKAPFDGYVTRVGVEEGQYLAREAEMLELVSLDPLKAEIMLPVELYGKLRKDRAYELDADPPVGRRVTCRLKHADRVFDAASATFRCVFEIDNSDGSLPAGFTVWFDASQLSDQ